MTLRTAGLVVVLVLGILAAPLSTDAQQAGRIPRIGVVGGASPSPSHPVNGFRQGLRELGYVEGQSIIVEYRWAHGEIERIPDLVADLIRLKVDVIVAGNTPAALAAKKATKMIPIVMAVVSDPVERGLIAGFARPGGNVTGLSPLAVELSAKQLELLKESVPGVSRVAVLWNPSMPAAQPLLKSVEAAAPSLGLQLQPVAARGPDEFDAAFSAMARARAGALHVLADPTFFLHRARLADLALKHRLPAMFGITAHAEAGGLMAYSADFADLFRRAAYYVDKILKGGKPADLPVEQPTRFEFVINLKTAKALGLTIPQSILIRADRVIQ